MADRPRRVVIAGASARAFAESAVRAGYRVAAVDAFGDLDLEAVAEVLALAPARGLAYSATAAARAARPLTAEAAAYTGGFENWPDAVRILASRRVLWGNPPEVLKGVRDPVRVARVVQRAGFVVPQVRLVLPRGRDARAMHMEWLIKPRRSAGGHGIRVWRPGEKVPVGCYLQERIDGIPASLVFAADGRRVVPLGLSRQLIGERAFGASGFRYCGSLLAAGGAPLFEDEATIRETAVALARAVTEAFGLVGLNGMDFIARAGVPVPIEINPRYTASMELVERASGRSMFATHVRACGGVLPRRVVGRSDAAVFGKAIVFARRAVRVGGSRRWLRDADVRDIPHPGERIARGRPVCTVFARARTAAQCHAALRRRAAAILRRLQPAGRTR